MKSIENTCEVYGNAAYLYLTFFYISSCQPLRESRELSPPFDQTLVIRGSVSSRLQIQGSEAETTFCEVFCCIFLTYYLQLYWKNLMLVPMTSSTRTLESVPSVIPERQITLFKFYMNCEVWDGMTYGNELYRLGKVFKRGDRLEAFRVGVEFIEQGIPSLISVSTQGYRVWVSLRNPLATQLFLGN